MRQRSRLGSLGVATTHLANTRTVLAYVRTALVLLGSGITVVHVTSYTFVGVFLIGLAVLVALVGALEYWHYKRLLDEVAQLRS